MTATELIRQHVDDWTPSDAEITATLNAATVPNPVPQQDVPRRLVKMEVLALLSDASKVKVLNYPNLDLVYRSFDAQDHASCSSWIQALYVVGAITAQEAGAALAHVGGTVPDPDYQENIPAPLLWFGRMVTAEDVYNARPEANASSEEE